MSKTNLTIEDEIERKIRQKHRECRHKFGSAIPAFNFEQDEAMFFVVCDRCGYKTD